MSHNIDVLLLAAGVGSRLKPLTEVWPKCLMPVHGRPLLEYWLSDLEMVGAGQIFVNLHHHANHVKSFLDRETLPSNVVQVFESELAGTAATIRNINGQIESKAILVAHADNWSHFDINAFIQFHFENNSDGLGSSMVTFETKNPENCGIVRVDSESVVQEFLEKKHGVKGSTANAAIYLFGRDVLDQINTDPNIKDISLDLIPKLVGKIRALHHPGIHRDIGTFDSLKDAQNDPKKPLNWTCADSWSQWFQGHKIHNLLAN